MGWVLLALWLAIGSVIPAPDTFLSLGRVFMLVIHVLTALMIYGVARKLRLSQPFAILAVVLFSLSPLVIILQRRILVENLMTLWVLISFYFVLGNKRTLLHYAVSALTLGMAFLTHVVALSFFPAIFYVVFKHSHSAHRRFALTLWLGIVASMFFGFPLHALLKDELLPAGVLFGGSHPHVSLYETQAVQLERISGQELLSSESSFIFNLKRWVSFEEAASDRGFIIAGLSSAALVLTMATLWRPHLRPLAWLMFLYGLHLVTLKRLFDPGIVPLLPLLAISIGIAAEMIFQLIKNTLSQRAISYPLYAGLATLLLAVCGWTYGQKFEIFRLDQTSMQIDAVRWLSQHAAPDSVVVSDSYAFVDLRQTLANAHYYWVVDEDVQVRYEVMDNNWCNIDYLVTTPQMLADINENQLQLSLTAFRGSESLKTYENNGWPIDIREVQKHNCNIPFP